MYNLNKETFVLLLSFIKSHICYTLILKLVVNAIHARCILCGAGSFFI